MHPLSLYQKENNNLYNFSQIDYNSEFILIKYFFFLTIFKGFISFH